MQYLSLSTSCIFGHKRGKNYLDFCNFLGKSNKRLHWNICYRLIFKVQAFCVCIQLYIASISISVLYTRNVQEILNVHTSFILFWVNVWNSLLCLEAFWGRISRPVWPWGPLASSTRPLGLVGLSSRLSWLNASGLAERFGALGRVRLLGFQICSISRQ